MKLPGLTDATPECTVNVLNAGMYRASLSHLMSDFPRRRIWGPALMFLIHHPVHGDILFDTGYSTRFIEATQPLPYRLMRYVTPVRVTEQEHAVQQLRDRNIDPDQVTVILSHMHVDHVGGLRDFPRSPIIVSKTEWEFTQRSALSLFKHFYLKSLFEGVDPQRVELIDFEEGVPYGPFPRSHDLYRDGSMILVPLPGHAAGQMGLLIHSTGGKRIFLIADAVYVRANYRTGKPGGWPSRYAHHQYGAYKELFPVLRRLEQDNEDLILLPSHDPEIYEKYVKGTGEL